MAQVTDVAEAKQTQAIVKKTEEVSRVLYIAMFVLMLSLNFAKELFWGSIRNLKDIFTLTLIMFT
jgi:hypothetical protein